MKKLKDHSHRKGRRGGVNIDFIICNRDRNVEHFNISIHIMLLQIIKEQMCSLSALKFNMVSCTGLLNLRLAAEKGIEAGRKELRPQS